MNRRNAIIAALSGMVGFMSGQAKAGNFVETRDAGGNLISSALPKGAVSFPLDAYTEFQFTCGTDRVTLTPDEIMAALKVGD